TVVIAPSRNADYPLRLTGFFLVYVQRSQRPAAASLAIGPVSTEAGPGGQGRVIPVAAAGRPLLAIGGATTAGPTQATAKAEGPGLLVTFRTGRAQANLGYFGQANGPVYTSPAVTQGPRTGPVPALATRGYLAASGTALGTVV